MNVDVEILLMMNICNLEIGATSNEIIRKIILTERKKRKEEIEVKVPLTCLLPNPP